MHDDSINTRAVSPIATPQTGTPATPQTGTPDVPNSPSRTPGRTPTIVFLFLIACLSGLLIWQGHGWIVGSIGTAAALFYGNSMIDRFMSGGAS